MFKTKFMAVAFAASMASAVSAAPLIFDPDGTGGGGSYSVDQLDWLPSSVLAVGGNQAIADFLNGVTDPTFTILSHFRLGTGLLGGVQVFDTSGMAYEITAVVGFTEKVTAVAPPDGSNSFAPLGGATFAYVDGESFVRIYFDPVKNANQLTGTGFGDGTLIFNSTVSTATGSYANIDSEADELNPLAPVLLDQAGLDDWNKQQTLAGAGINTNFVIDVATPTFVDDNFFKNLPLLQFLITNVSLNNPFVTTDPSYAFTQSGGSLYDVTTDAGVNSTLGDINGGLAFIGNGSGIWVASGPDFIFSTDFNSSVRATPVPEPASLALLGLALGVLGVFGRRRKLD